MGWNLIDAFARLEEKETQFVEADSDDRATTLETKRGDKPALLDNA